MSWWPILVLGMGAYAVKALGLLVGADRPLPGVAERALLLLPAALLPALIVVQTFATERHLTIDARAVGVAAGAVCVWRKWPFAVTVLVAAASAAIWRAAG